MWFSSKDEYWKWLETNNQTSENIIDKRFDLREIVSLTRESAQNSVDAFLHSTSDVDRNHASIKYKFFSSNADLSKYFSGLIEAREVLDKSGLCGSLYSKKIDFNNCSYKLHKKGQGAPARGPFKRALGPIDETCYQEQRKPRSAHKPKF